MISSNQIKADATVVCSNNTRLATVDHMEGAETIKLKKDASGQHHFIPLAWVTKVDDKVHLGRPAEQARKDWTTAPVGKPLPFVPADKSAKLATEPVAEKVVAEKPVVDQAATGVQAPVKNL